MMDIRRADTLGTAHSDGLALRCHFAFADYQDPAHIHDGRLRVLNLGQIGAGATYHLGPEASVDIVTWVRAGSLRGRMDGCDPQPVEAGGVHLASTGGGCAGVDWCAGADGASFIQFWLLADIKGTTPAQETRTALPGGDGGFVLLASGFPEDDPEESGVVADGAPVALSARARLAHAAIPAGEGAAYGTCMGRDLYVVVVSGTISIGEDILDQGDAAALTGATDLTVIARRDAVVLLVDVAA
ncbi:hypothetical protein CFR78_04440 [Komagataeibacter rhaeticus]|uniref:pirin family protein n=1 Tax=Komagataeibacter rhaeticus TaxID=215221 RepID=UPI0004D751B7|nr:hypothetical protein [Komagataeibacter rhaeticus]KDU97397.1 pirin [Komagataeibacter rhaeticus AF1]MBL7238944.1 hypothetical protein [Komagataeibacter rhaeticus]PYD54222.1 hypothetical protein CFR78_04440 [Komagataeibacter rhaeticus]